MQAKSLHDEYQETIFEYLCLTLVFKVAGMYTHSGQEAKKLSSLTMSLGLSQGDIIVAFEHQTKFFLVFLKFQQLLKLQIMVQDACQNPYQSLDALPLFFSQSTGSTLCEHASQAYSPLFKLSSELVLCLWTDLIKTFLLENLLIWFLKWNLWHLLI